MILEGLMVSSLLLRHRLMGASLLLFLLVFPNVRVFARQESKPLALEPGDLELVISGALQSAPKLPGQSELELRISGPAIIHRNDRVEFKAMLVNHSSVAVLISPPERSREPAIVSWWDATDASGVPLGHESIGYCIVDGLDYSRKWRLTDNSIRMLKPGESAEVPLTFSDPRDPLKFRKKGTYQLTLYYFFSPPRREPDTKDGKLVLTNYETSALSPANIKALRDAAGISLVSNPFTIVLE